MKNVQELADLRAVVTGASSGIGAAIARELAAAGAHCFLQWRSNRAGAESVAEQVRACGVECGLFQSDFSDTSTHPALVDAAWAWHAQGIDIWINNAGADVLTGELAGWSFEQKLQALFAVDVVGTLTLTRLAGARMKAQGRGAIVNIGWDQAAIGMAGDSGELFATTKGAIMAFTRSAARSLAPQVRVNCVAPGWIKTAWGDGASEYWQQRARKESVLDRWGTPEDVAQAVRFLASPQSGFVTGHVLPVNGGIRIS